MSLVSVLTPTWNRGAYLERVWNGLNNQTYNNLEWIVCDDGSTDDTEGVLRELGKKSTFPITIVKASVHIGKARMDNEGIARAGGEFILLNDSDDYLLPTAIQQLVAAWNSISANSKGEYFGIAALCATDLGVVSSPLPGDGQFDGSWNDLRNRYKVKGDMLLFVKRVALQEHPFPEVDFVVPEGVVWSAIGSLKIKTIPEVLLIKEYNSTKNSITYSGKMEYCRGRAYAMAVSGRNTAGYRRDIKTRLWNLITYLRCCIHGEVAMQEARRHWGNNSYLVTFLAMLPLAYLLALKDQLHGKVRKTHLEFLKANREVAITCYQIGTRRVGDA